jgi:D-alanyl-D-alanine carboxypeptidase
VKFDVDFSDPNNLTDYPPQTTAKSLSIFDIKKMTCVYGKNLDHKLEIASMTKIMTAFLICILLDQDL